MTTRTPLPRGIYVPLITPFTPDGAAVDLDALEKLAVGVLDQGAVGLVALGTTAEAASLDADERRAVAAVCRRVCRERGAPVIVGTSGNDTAKTAAELADMDADAALVAVPYFTRPSEDGVVAHFAHLAERSSVPMVVYNVPYRSGRTLSAETLRRLAALPGVTGVKHAVGSVDSDTIALLAEPPEDFAVFAGDDVFLSPLLALGASGAILASAHVATREFVGLVYAWRAGDVTRARDLGGALAAVSAALFAEPNPTVVKAVLHRQGRLPDAAVRLPLLPAGRTSVDAAVAALGRLA
jgi:4-hydroxy-tetrahydrodipicolinate synthase